MNFSKQCRHWPDAPFCSIWSWVYIICFAPGLSCSKLIIIFAFCKSIDQDQRPQNAASDQCQHCLPSSSFWKWTWSYIFCELPVICLDCVMFPFLYNRTIVFKFWTNMVSSPNIYSTMHVQNFCTSTSSSSSSSDFLLMCRYRATSTSVGPLPPGSWLAAQMADLTPDLQVCLSYGLIAESFLSLQPHMQTVYTQIRLLWRSNVIRVYTVCLSPSNLWNKCIKNKF